MYYLCYCILLHWQLAENLHFWLLSCHHNQRIMVAKGVKSGTDRNRKLTTFCTKYSIPLAIWTIWGER